MNYNLSEKKEAKAAYDRLRYLTKKGQRCRLSKISKQRSLNQNSYLHLLLGLFAVETGLKLEEAKTIYKRQSPEVYVYRKNNEAFLKSSTDLTVDEMTVSIDRFRQFASEQGIDLPAAMTQEEMLSLENLIERNGQYL